MTRGILDWHGTSLVIPAISCTVDAQRRASSLPWLVGSGNPYTQATNANKPVAERTDNAENMMLYSKDMSQSKGVEGLTSRTVSAELDLEGDPYYQILASATSNRHGLFLLGTDANGLSGGAGQNVTFECEVKTGTTGLIWVGDRFASWHGSFFNIGTLTWGQEVNLTSRSFEVLANGAIKFVLTYNKSAGNDTRPGVYIANSTTGTSPSNFAAAGTETILTGNWWHYQTGKDRQRVVTTAEPAYAGMNGRSGLRFSGAQWLSTISTLGDIVANNSKLFYIVAVSYLFDATVRTLIGDGNPGTGMLTQSPPNPRFIIYNGDGSADFANNGVHQSAGVPYIVRGRHSGGNLYFAVDSGAGFVEGAPVASGDTVTMTNALRLGARADGSAGFYGSLYALATDDDGTLNADTTEYEEIMRRFFFTQTVTQSSNIRIADNTLLQEALTISASSSLEAGHDPYSLVSSKRSNFIQRSAAGTTQNINIACRSGNEQRCNYLIVTKARRLAAAGATSISLQYSNDNTTWDNFLTSDFSEYVGEFQQDIFLYSNTSSVPYQYWRVAIAGSSNKFPLANIYAGMLFDYEREPDNVDWQAEMLETRKEATKGDIHLARTEKPTNNFDLMYRAIEDTKLQEARRFVDKQQYLPVFIVTTEDHILLNNIKCLHCQITDYRVTKEITNYNEITLSVKELIK
jgi:hypothetical protein